MDSVFVKSAAAEPLHRPPGTTPYGGASLATAVSRNSRSIAPEDGTRNDCVNSEPSERVPPLPPTNSRDHCCGAWSANAVAIIDARRYAEIAGVGHALHLAKPDEVLGALAAAVMRG